MQSSVSPTDTASLPEALPPQMMLMQMITSYWVAQSIYAAAKLSIADQLKDGAKHYEQIATVTQTNPSSLYRLLRALSGVGIFAETEEGYFALTPLGDYLRSDSEGSLRDISVMLGDPEHYGSWGNLVHSVQTGGSAFEYQHGMNIFEYYAQNPGSAAVFDLAMTSFSSAETSAVVSAYDFSSFHTLVDVAGGHGSLLGSVLKATPNLKGVLFDQPDVIERAKPIIQSDPSLEGRCQLVSGSFFESVPPGADAYMMKHILHDWDDERAIAILQQCHRAMTDEGKVLIIELVIPPGNQPSMGKLLDMNMLVMCPGGKERTEAEYRGLFKAAGFELTRIVPTPGMVSIVEGIKV